MLAVSLSVVKAQPGAGYIVIDQFGYPNDAGKIAVIRDPQTGFDADESYAPGTTWSVIETSSGDPVYTGVITRWNDGATDASSGDRIWYFDFSTVSETGNYYILDESNGQRSYTFRIAPNVYNEVLKQAVRTFFYQRVGFAKDAAYAGEEWADGASHMGELQDTECRSFFAKDDPSTERDVSGGWYDAGDYNKYTSWTANYVVEFMRAYLENPAAWGDDYNIPGSGNGVPDLLDEAKWGIDHLMRLQLDDGSVLSIVGEDGGSPPSSATGPSYYGKVNTSGTLNVAAAFALGSKVFRVIGQEVYADTLLARAELAWNWAEANPDVFFNNNDPAYNSEGLGAGRMEVDAYGLEMIRLEAACFLFDVTGNTSYRDYFDANYTNAHLFQWTYAYPYESENQEALLYYLTIEDGTPAVKDAIRSKYRSSMLNSSNNMPAINSHADPYFAFLDSYTWGSNRTKSAKGIMFMDMVYYDIDPVSEQKATGAALRYVNYLHGVNPLSFVYLSNMYDYGAENCVNEFFHSWFRDGSSKWDRVGVSDYGPPPGYLTGGPNSSYNWDGCCPDGCGSPSNNSICTSEDLSPPRDQPAQKSYKDFNTSWPLNSWSVTENSCGYQIMYIRLLSNFVTAGIDCNGDAGGTAFMDSCGVCAGGNTGLVPELDPEACSPATDCNGDTGGTAFTDSCGICAGGETGRVPVLEKAACYDCYGDFNGTAFIDSCGICAEGQTGRSAVLYKEACYDCNNEFNGTAFLDSCGICAGGGSGRVPVLSENECFDCNGDFNGTAFIDSCGICAEGNTGLTAVLDTAECEGSVVASSGVVKYRIFPNPAGEILNIRTGTPVGYTFKIMNMSGAIVQTGTLSGNQTINISGLPDGIYEFMMIFENDLVRRKLIKD